MISLVFGSEKKHHWRAFRESIDWWYYTCPSTPGRLAAWRPGNCVSSWSAVSRVCRDPSTAHRFARQTHPASMACSCWDQWTPPSGPTRKRVLGRQKTGSPSWLLELIQADAHIITHRCVHCVCLSVYLSVLASPASTEWKLFHEYALNDPCCHSLTSHPWSGKLINTKWQKGLTKLPN